MKKEGNIALNFKKTGYNDYKASRFLLNNDFYIQGITLASSAVEKYLKAILIANGATMPVHLDKLNELKKVFQKIDNNIIDSMDSSFLEILGKAYKLRYYDNFKEKVSFGFLLNQVIAELDFTINLLDSHVIIKNYKTGELIKSDYQKDVEIFDEIICKDNYLIKGENKKLVMEKKGKLYSLMIDEIGREFAVYGGEMRAAKYTGKIIQILDMSFK